MIEKAHLCCIECAWVPEPEEGPPYPSTGGMVKRGPQI